MAFSEFQFPSANGRDTVWGWRVTPLGRPKAAVQLIQNEHFKTFRLSLEPHGAAQRGDGGAAAQGGIVYRNDVSKLTKAERAEIARRVNSGEVISF